MNQQSGFVKIALIVLVVILAAVVGDFILVKKSPEIAQQTNTPAPTSAQNQSNTQTPNPPSETANWKTYRNEQYNFEFKHNPNWSIAPINTGSGYDASRPFILLWTGTTSDAPCQDLGCPPKSGDRDELTKGDTLEGSPPLNPWFKILRVRVNKWVSIQVTDTSKNCSSEAACQQYLSGAPLEQRIKVNNQDYKTYNDFIELLSTFKFTN